MSRKAERVLALCEGNFDPIDWKTSEMVFLGRDGFRPSEVTIKLGENITMHNHNDEWFGLAFTLVRDKPKRKVFNSKQIAYGELGQIAFEEPGVYTIFQEQFAPRGKIIVEE